MNIKIHNMIREDRTFVFWDTIQQHRYTTPSIILEIYQISPPHWYTTHASVFPKTPAFLKVLLRPATSRPNLNPQASKMNNNSPKNVFGKFL